MRLYIFYITSNVKNFFKQIIENSFHRICEYIPLQKITLYYSYFGCILILRHVITYHAEKRGFYQKIIYRYGQYTS